MNKPILIALSIFWKTVAYTAYTPNKILFNQTNKTYPLEIASFLLHFENCIMKVENETFVSEEIISNTNQLRLSINKTSQLEPGKV
jgi:hypothetical protein